MLKSSRMQAEVSLLDHWSEIRYEGKPLPARSYHLAWIHEDKYCHSVALESQLDCTQSEDMISTLGFSKISSQ